MCFYRTQEDTLKNAGFGDLDFHCVETFLKISFFIFSEKNESEGLKQHEGVFANSKKVIYMHLKD